MRYLVGFLVLFIVSCSTTPKAYGPKDNAVTVMAYNVENLFDTQQDANREDYTFLPLRIKQTEDHRIQCQSVASSFRRRECLGMDWNENILNTKLSRLADVIQQVNNGHGPDVLIMPEVENINALHLLNRHLKKAGYKEEILIEGPDLRGIDIGILSRLPQTEPAILHKIPFKPKSKGDAEWMARSRGILEATFRLPDQRKLTVFGVHLPSQANPTYWREQAIDYLNELKKSVPADHLIIAAGDFNITHEEDARSGLFRERVGQSWLISHYIGCGGCRGTHSYKGSWSFLDVLLFDKSMGMNGTSSWVVDFESIRVPTQSRYQTNSFMSPARFDERNPVGVSDHYPILAVIKPRPQDNKLGDAR